MPPYIVGVVDRSLPLLRAQFIPAVKRNGFNSDWYLESPALRPGWTWRLSPVQQMRFASNNDKKWYDWYARLRADPKATEKDLKKAFYKRAKVEHPDHDKTPGAKARFQNASNSHITMLSITSVLTDGSYVKLQDTFNNLCDDSKRKKHDQERLARQRVAADAAARMTATQPSVADSLRAKWKAGKEALRKADDIRTREARKTSQEGHQRAKPSKTSGSGAESQQPKGSKSKSTKEAPRKEQQQQAKAEETEADRLRKQKIADDLLAKKKAASEEKKKRREGEAAEKTRQNNHPQMRVIVIRGLPKETKLIDLLEPLINLTPGPVFRVELRSQVTAEIEFCTTTAARKVFDLAKEKRLFIKGERVAHVNLVRSANKLPVIGSKSRVLSLRRVFSPDFYVKKSELEDFLRNHILQVERTMEVSFQASDFTVRFASWAEAERAKLLLARDLPGLSATYGPDPCETQSGLYGTVGVVLEAWGWATTEREREELVEVTLDIFTLITLIFLLGWVAWYFEMVGTEPRRTEGATTLASFRLSEPGALSIGSRRVIGSKDIVTGKDRFFFTNV